jgi:membrane-associated protease RseP (regulator of RpoE activity)
LQLDPEKKSHVTSVGLAIDGDVIHGFHPQFEFSKLEVSDSKLEIGDRIMKIDGKQVDSFGTGLVRALIGDDIVGSLVNITVAKPDGSEVRSKHVHA